MNPRAIWAAAAVLAVLAAEAPAAHAQPVLGVIGGFTRSSFTGSGATDVSGRAGFLLGVSGELPFGETFALRPELHFTTKGAWVETLLGDPAAGPRKRFELPYIQVPVLAQLRPALNGGPLRPHLFGGVSLGLLLSCSLAEQDCGDIEEVDYRRADVGVVVGGEIGWGRVGVGARYEAGVRAVEASIRGNELHNGALSFTARYLLGG